MTTQVSAELKSRIRSILLEGIAKIEKRYGIKMEYPTVTYNQGGGVAGMANYKKWTIKYNPVLLNENVEVFLARTVPHELAHLACDRIYPEAHATEIVRTRSGKLKRTKRDVHGNYWKEIMRVLGVSDIGRCHSYDTTSVKRAVTKYNYSCGCGESVHQVGAKVHNKVALFGAKYTCKKCKQFIRPANQGKTIAPVIRPVVATKVPSAGGTKIDRARALLASMIRPTREDAINAFMAQLDMTKAGAGTYYYNLTK
jgi:SprT protein